jgi:hypothetical protein
MEYTTSWLTCCVETSLSDNSWSLSIKDCNLSIRRNLCDVEVVVVLCGFGQYTTGWLTCCVETSLLENSWTFSIKDTVIYPLWENYELCIILVPIQHRSSPLAGQVSVSQHLVVLFDRTICQISLQFSGG